ncbi:MAG TPA: type II toxin-antitoxin system VapC family toxin [Thermoplasmata archaeon]|nr:type II toxin-antitoxin system VapC family toxin [Thermoplasmata archaeon]
MPAEPPVLDSSAISRMVLLEDGWESVDEVIQRAEDHDLVPRSLEFAKLEALSSIWKHVALFRKLDLTRALLLVESLSTQPINYEVADDALMKHALELGVRHRHSTYDTSFVALAKRTGGMLVTTDEKLSKIAAKYVKVLLV